MRGEAGKRCAEWTGTGAEGHCNASRFPGAEDVHSPDQVHQQNGSELRGNPWAPLMRSHPQTPADHAEDFSRRYAEDLDIAGRADDMTFHVSYHASRKAQAASSTIGPCITPANNGAVIIPGVHQFACRGGRAGLVCDFHPLARQAATRRARAASESIVVALGASGGEHVSRTWTRALIVARESVDFKKSDAFFSRN